MQSISSPKIIITSVFLHLLTLFSVNKAMCYCFKRPCMVILNKGVVHMLDKKCRKIVKCCLKYYPDERIIQTTDLQKHLNFSKMEIRYCCQRLNKLGFFDSFQTSIEDTVHFVPSYKLFNYKEHERTKIKEFLINSVSIPVIVSTLSSILITLITLMISGILQ